MTFTSWLTSTPLELVFFFPATALFPVPAPFLLYRPRAVRSHCPRNTAICDAARIAAVVQTLRHINRKSPPRFPTAPDRGQAYAMRVWDSAKT